METLMNILVVLIVAFPAIDVFGYLFSILFDRIFDTKLHDWFEKHFDTELDDWFEHNFIFSKSFAISMLLFVVYIFIILFICPFIE